VKTTDLQGTGSNKTIQIVGLEKYSIFAK